MSATVVGGIDPGPRPGLVLLHIEDQRIVRLERGAHLSWRSVIDAAEYVAVEKYVRGSRSAYVGSAAAQLTTEAMARDAHAAAVGACRVLLSMPAGTVKPWATDDRLRAYGVVYPPTRSEDVYTLTRGQGGHDRDAARHALYMAVRLGLLPKR